MVAINRNKTVEKKQPKPLLKRKVVEKVEEKQESKELVPVYDASIYDPYLLPPYEVYEPKDYRDGPEGFIKWCEEMVFIPVYPEGSDIAVWTSMGKLDKRIHPKSGKSYDHIWQMQKEEVRKCLRMVHGRFVYRLIVLVWMRGEGKSLLACLIQLWKFFCWPKQQIVLGANSKDQIRFVHYDIIRDIIKNSPKLIDAIGERNVQEKEIRIRDEQGNVSSVIRAISSFSGIVSNITGYTFSEMFDMKNPKFFTQLDGSIRNIPNALGVIDSTVSPKTHVLYKMYQSYVTRATKTLFFSYRCSKDAKIEDYWNPNMDQQQLDDYRAKFPLGDFEKYFMNVWGSNAQQIFTPEMVEATHIIGVDGRICTYSEIKDLVARKVKVQGILEGMLKTSIPSNFEEERNEIKAISDRLTPVDSIYVLRDAFGNPRAATLDDLDRLSEIYDTDWAILMGLDRADPLKSGRTPARTIVTTVAKGLPRSRTNPQMADDGNPQYIYVLLDLAHIATSLLEDIKDKILQICEEFEGIDALCGERWGLWDIAQWCEDSGIKLELIHPSYDKQKAAFSELHGAVSTGRFKAASIAVWGSKNDDIFKEEAEIFYHDEEKRWFGSPEKNEKHGAQDDVMFSIAWGIHGGRDFRADMFRERHVSPFFGTMMRNKNTLVKY